ncbi:histidine kinase [Duganella sp. CF458]|uniref:histidine kinase n=1 Tax=Duganella sp. CF458 TaxID=1884368 RepID=UPI00148161B2|nr:histidine kinase [Duganella sp. CF458]
MTRLLMLCCLLLLHPFQAVASMSLDKLAFQEVGVPFEECGSVAGTVTGPFSFDQLGARQAHCIQAEFTISRQPDRPQHLLLSMLASSEIYLDGMRVGVNGVPAESAQGERQGRIDYQLALAPEQLSAGRHRLVLKLSTWHGSERIREQFYNLSVEDDAPTAARKTLPLVLAGALALVAALATALLVYYQRKADWCVFAMLCVTASLLLVTEAWRGVAGYEYGYHLARLMAVQVLTGLFSLLLPAYFMFAYALPRKRYVAGAAALAVAAIAGTSLHFDAKAALMFSVALVASAAINLHALRRGAAVGRSGLAVVLLSLALWLVPGTGFFAETGFALVVFLLLFTILGQLLRQLIRDRNKALLATRLENQLLRKSLQPHFLMNSLSSIGELVHHSPLQAEQFVEALGREFRMLGDYASQVTIPLSRELELCHNYLAIMAVRLQRHCSLKVSGEPGALCLPPAVLLTCLENAFSHNRYRDDLVFDMDIAHSDGHAILSLAMPLADGRKHQGSGTGSTYIHSSLQEAFAGSASYQGRPGEGIWLATIRLPA